MSATPEGPPRRVARPVAASLLVGAAAVPPSLLLAAPALVGLEADRLVQTAVPLACTASAVTAAAALAGAYRGARNPVHVCMSAALAALLLVGFSTFVALEPAWWRFAVGLAGPLLVVALVAYGAPVARHALDASAATVARRWLGEPLRLLAALGRALAGREGRTASGSRA
ncbi:MAG: hypothetical protein HY904_12460 [Deltaproteobacteria bacterium]|nr:hypothetical protein [Deltaproteobacteria bacterium]